MNSEEYIEIELHCYSQRQNVSLGCGISYKNDGDPIDLADTEWIWVGISECYWENYFEFEDGLTEAKLLVNTGAKSTIFNALYEVFGKFIVEYTVNGEKTALEYSVDVEGIIYNLLIDNSDM